MINKLAAKERGFTIVELLIVIVVIAILAAITIVAYNGVQQKAKAALYQTDVTAMVKKVETFNAATGAYPLVAAGVTDTAAAAAQTADGIALTGVINAQPQSVFPTDFSIFAVLTTAAAAPTYAQTITAATVNPAVDSYFVRYCTTGKGMYVYYPDPTTSTVKTANVGVCP